MPVQSSCWYVQLVVVRTWSSADDSEYKPTLVVSSKIHVSSLGDMSRSIEWDRSIINQLTISLLLSSSTIQQIQFKNQLLQQQFKIHRRQSLTQQQQQRYQMKSRD